MTQEEKDQLVRLRDEGLGWAELGERFGMNHLRARHLYMRLTKKVDGKRSHKAKVKVPEMLKLMRYVVANPVSKDESEKCLNVRDHFVSRPRDFWTEYNRLEAEVREQQRQLDPKVADSGDTKVEVVDEGTDRCLKVVEDWLRKLEV